MKGLPRPLREALKTSLSSRAQVGLGRFTWLTIRLSCQRLFSRRTDEQTRFLFHFIESDTPDISNIKISLQQFISAFLEHYQPPTDETVLRQSFQVFDPQNTGQMSVNRFEEMMTKRGEPISPEELQEMMILANVSGKNFDYASLAEKLIKGPRDAASL